MPGLEHPLPVLGLAAGRDGDDRDARRPGRRLAPADLARRRRPVEPRHHAVNQQQVERLGGQAVERLGPAGHRHDLQAACRELAPGDPAVALAVVGHEDPPPTAARRSGPGVVVAVHAGSILQRPAIGSIAPPSPTTVAAIRGAAQPPSVGDPSAPSQARPGRRKPTPRQGPRPARRAGARTRRRRPRPPRRRSAVRPRTRRQSAIVWPSPGPPDASTSTATGSVVDQARVERRRDHQRVVDERAVEAVVAGVELEVEPEGVGEEPDHRVARDRPPLRRQRARGRGRACRPAGSRPGGPRRRRRRSSAAPAPSRRGRAPALAGRRGVRVDRRLPRREGEPRRLRVAVDVPLGHRRRVAGHAERPAHAHPAPQEPRAAPAPRAARSRGWSAARASPASARPVGCAPPRRSRRDRTARTAAPTARAAPRSRGRAGRGSRA